jgi:hypothetical protein
MWSVCEYKHRVRRRPNSIDVIDVDFREPPKYDEYQRFDLNDWKWDVIEPNRCRDDEEDIIMYQYCMVCILSNASIQTFERKRWPVA